MSTPAVVIAAPSSGSGKTTVATGLMGALREAGHRVAPFKVGPDFIDPGYHALAAGRPGRNLDPVLVGEQLIGPLYRHGTADADIAVVEGVMGLFDGRIDDQVLGPAMGSTAHVAGLLGAPVVLVIDARGQSHSVAALLHGFSTFDQSARIVGAILNRVGSPRHEDVLRQAWNTPCAGAGRHPPCRRTLRSLTASWPGDRCRVRPSGPGRRRRDDGAGRPARRPGRHRRRRWRAGCRCRLGSIRSRAGRQRVTAHWPPERRSASATPNTATAARGRRRRGRVDPLTDRCHHTPPRWCCPVDSPNSSPPNCPPTTLCAIRSTLWPPTVRRFTPNARD